jgi:DivIVA domain-containing protein
VEAIERIRSATFSLARRGYDRREVDNYLSKLADWLEGGGADQVHSDTIANELERVGRRVAKILRSAEDTAKTLRAEAEQEARDMTEDARIQVESAKVAAEEYARKARDQAQVFAARTREEAESDSRRTREAADQHAEKVRGEADTYATERLEQAEAKAVRMVEEGARRRREMEKIIADLQTRREAVVKGLEKLSSQLAGAATEGKTMEPAREASRRASGAKPAAEAKPVPTRQ